MMKDEDAVKVHVVADDTKAVMTEEREPEHFTAVSFTLPAIGITSGDQADYNANDPVQIMQLDPLRKEAVISFNGTGQVLLAHSQAQAISLQQGADQNADAGDLITCPTTIRVEGTGPLWAVQANISQTPNGGVSLYAAGSAIPTVANTAFVTLTGLPPGSYQVTTSEYIDGTLVSADDEDNMRLFNNTAGTIVAAPILVPADSATAPIVTQAGPFIVTVSTISNLSMRTNTLTPSGTATYHASILAVPISGSSPNSLIIGVLQERRGA